MFCSYCGQGFKRDEHLERHILTHTNLRPFRCRECKVTFKRKDLLRRHYRSIHGHASEDDNQDTTTRVSGVGRTAIACARCAQSKTKCDTREPCGRCVAKNLPCERRRVRRSVTKDHTNASTPPFMCIDFKSSGKNDAGNTPAFDELHLSLDDTFPFFPDIEHLSCEDMDFSTVMNMEESPPAMFQTPTSFSSGSPSPNLVEPIWTLTPDDDSDSFPTPQRYTTTSVPVPDSHSAWPSFKCSPQVSEELTSSAAHLFSIKLLEDPGIWRYLTPGEDPSTTIIPSTHYDASNRDRLLVSTQQLWQTAKETLTSSWPGEQQDPLNSWMDRVILLPPADLLGHFIGKYQSQESDRLHVLPVQELPATGNMLYTSNTLLDGVSTLLAVAQAIRSSAKSEARAISGGLVEVCRIAIQGADMIVNLEFLNISLSLLQLLQWSGDSWHMTAVPNLWEQHAKLVQNELLAKLPPVSKNDVASLLDMGTDSMDIQTRLLHSWVAVDLELGIFHDLPPKLSAASVGSPRFPQREGSFYTLRAAFERFLEGSQAEGVKTTPATLRLLLHPLQCMSVQLHQCLAVFGSIQESQNSALGLASKAFIDELDSLLERWHRLTMNIIQKRGSACPITKASLVLYHLMVLNNLVCFPDVESWVRGTELSSCSQKRPMRSYLRVPCANSVASLLFHCGQLIFHLRSMSHVERPLWWAAALYRLVLVLLHLIVLNEKSGFSFITTRNSTTPIIVLDKEYSLGELGNDITMQRFFNRLHGIPALTGPDESVLLLDSVEGVLDLGLAWLDEYLVFEFTEFTNGIRMKLGALKSRWKGFG